MIELLWPIAKRFLPWIALIAGLLSVYLYLDHRSFQRGAESRQPEINRLTTDNATLSSNVNLLTASIDAQNKAVAQLKAEADQRAKDGAVALATAKKANEGLVATASALRKSAGVSRSINDCSLSPALRGVQL